MRHIVILITGLLFGYLDVSAQGTITRPHKSQSATTHKPSKSTSARKPQNKTQDKTKRQTASSRPAISPNQKRILEQIRNNMVRVEGGTFWMGSTTEQGSDASADERPAHVVSLSTYYINRYEVTQEEWQAIMGNNPSYHKGSDLPVENVSWYDCQKFVRRISEMSGLPYCLPTEEEWEFAARGGNKSQGYKYAGTSSYPTMYIVYSSGDTKTVGSKFSNELTLYDMSGNVQEWCGSEYISYRGMQGGHNSNVEKVIRGGCFISLPKTCRVSTRSYDKPSVHNNFTGFRLAMRY